MMGDGKALQAATSHELGQNFARAFGTDYLSSEGTRELVWQTSWGSTTRLIGALVMAHGDDNGLRLPPHLAPVQTVVIAVKGEEPVLRAVRELTERLRERGVRAESDEDARTPFGRRSVDWELKGVPARIEIGPRDLADGTATLVRRASGGPKEPVRLDALPELLPRVLEEEQALLWRQSRQWRAEHTSDVRTIGEAAEAVSAGGWARLPWARLGVEGERRLAESAMSVRCLVAEDGSVPPSDAAPDVSKRPDSPGDSGRETDQGLGDVQGSGKPEILAVVARAY